MAAPAMAVLVMAVLVMVGPVMMAPAMADRLVTTAIQPSRNPRRS
jgi:hypothetical protein